MMNQDRLVKGMLDFEIWSEIINKANDKDLSLALLRPLGDHRNREALVNSILNNEHVIEPAKIAAIPKKEIGQFREVHVNTDIDRIILKLINDVLCKEFTEEYVHENCTSYQRGVSYQAVVKDVSEAVQAQENNFIGYKMDLAKYFDSVPRKLIMDVFDSLEKDLGAKKDTHPVINMLRTYYKLDKVYDKDGTLITLYGGLKQGCAIGGFLANTILKDIDTVISDMKGITYYRYCDDLIVIGENAEEAKRVIEKMLAIKGLKLNEQKVFALFKKSWFDFLGYSLKDDLVTLTWDRLANFQQETQDIVNNNTAHTTALRKYKSYLYEGNYSWAKTVLRIMNCPNDEKMLNSYILDNIRALEIAKNLKKNKEKSTIRVEDVGTLTTKTYKHGTIQREFGKEVSVNRLVQPEITGYKPVSTIINALNTSNTLYRTIISDFNMCSN